MPFRRGRYGINDYGRAWNGQAHNLGRAFIGLKKRLLKNPYADPSRASAFNQQVHQYLHGGDLITACPLLMRWTALLPPCGMIAGREPEDVYDEQRYDDGLDIAKSVFQAHGVDATGEIVIRRILTRGRMLAFFVKLPRCLVGIEACSSRGIQ